jgi:hypothetical protein
MHFDRFPEVEVARARVAGVVVDRDARHLDQPALDRIDQAEVADDPLEGRAFLAATAADVVGRGGEVETEVDAAHRVDAVEPADPHGGLGVLFGVGGGLDAAFALAQPRQQRLDVGVGDAVGVVGLVVDY